MKFHLLNILILFTLLKNLSEACGPGRGGGRRRMIRKYPPLVQRQYWPNMGEHTLGASGQPEGKFTRQDKRFKELVQNNNQDIEFKDDEKTGADKMMTQRLKEKLSTLAISVMNQWPNVKLRVIEGWDEDGRHPVDSLHYEGRAVDITTSDRDTTKYGMLARLAVEAGFDWVHYENRYHVHCSVKSEKADTIRNNGCFDSSSVVVTPDGEMEMSQLQTNDFVLTMNPQTGQFNYSPIIMWLDRNELGEDLFVEIKTKSNRIIRLTSSHLIYLSDEQPPQPPVDANNNNINSTQQEETATTTTTGNSDYNNNNNNQNYYFYETQATANSAKANAYDGSSSSSETNSAINTHVPSTNNNKVNQLPNDDLSSSSSSSSPSYTLTKLPPTLSIDDIAFTTYARNAIVGQYLLVSGIEQQQQQTTIEGEQQTISEFATKNSKEIVLASAPHKKSEQITTTHDDDHDDHDDDEDSVVVSASARSVLDARAWKPVNPDYYFSQTKIERNANQPNGRLVFGNKKTDLDSFNNYDINSGSSQDDVQASVTDSAEQLEQSTMEITSGEATVLFDQIVSVNYVTRKGIYAPLTREGNIVVNSIVASCYAVTNDHELAHMSFAPVRWYSYIKEWLIGLEPRTPSSQRTLEAVSRQQQQRSSDDQQLEISKQNQQQQQQQQDTHQAYPITNIGTNYINSRSSSTREINWYASMLYGIARILLPTRYMY